MMLCGVNPAGIPLKEEEVDEAEREEGQQYQSY